MSDQEHSRENREAQHRLDEIDSRARKLLASRLANRLGTDEADSGRTTENKSYRLSFGQERLCFLQELDPKGTAYNILVGYDLEGPVDLRALDLSLRDIVARHDALRTKFSASDSEVHKGQKLQQVLSTVPSGLHVVDAEQDVEQAALARLEAAARAPFNLSEPPLFRVCIARRNRNRHRLLFCVHHVIADARSMEVLLDELSKAYESRVCGRSPSLPALPIRYVDFAERQYRVFESGALQQELDYWESALAGLNRSPALPHRSHRVQSGRGLVQSIRGSFSPEIHQGLRHLAREERTTTFTVTLAALAVVLHAYGSSEDIALGTPVAGRPHSNLRNIVGFFLNTLILRTRVTPRMSFRSVLRTARETVLDALDHAQIPFERLVAAQDEQGELQRTPLFDVLVNFEEEPPPTTTLVGTQATAIEPTTYAPKFDLSVAFRACSGGLDYHWAFDPNVFDTYTIESAAECLQRVVEQVIIHPDLPVNSLDVHGPSDRRDSQVDRIESKREESTTCLHDLIEAHARTNPDRIAVVVRNQRLSYRALNARANDLAHRLSRAGVGPETRVGVYMKRDLDLIVGLVAILKAGGAYVPLDPDAPQERLDYLIEDSGVRIALVSDTDTGELPGKVLTLSPEPGHREDSPLIRHSPDQLAYLIYTSGSTGKPKGVEISHRNAMALLGWADSHYSSDEIEAVFAGTSISFDLSVFEIFLPLTTGHRIVLGKDTLDLPSHPAAEEVSLVNTVPTAFAELLRSSEWPASIRAVNLAGEVLSVQVVTEVRKQLHHATLRNLYAPSETTTYSTCERVDPTSEQAPCIGRPIGDTHISILSPAMQYLPQAAIGELTIGGAGVARGYHGRAALTAAKFVPHPHGRGLGERIYRTGDRGRFLEDGRIEFRGRQDDQYKVRGHRIEAGEVEAALTSLENVQEAVVQPVGELAERRLIAWIVPQSKAPLDPRELRSKLARELPAWMVPDTFVFQETFPRTPTGKVDRQALQVPRVPSTTSKQRESKLPNTAMEVELVRIWSELLQTPKLGIEDDFFELGGQSILAMRLIARMRAELQVDLPLRVIFEASNIAALAERVETERASSNLEGHLPLEPRAAEEPWVLSAAQRRLWFLDQLGIRKSAFRLTICHELRGAFAAELAEAALREVVSRHEPLRTVFRNIKGKPLPRLLPREAFELAVVDARGISAQRREAIANRIVGQQAQREFDLEHGPLVRSILVRLSEERHKIVLSVHHIAADGWSMGIFLQDLATAYRALLERVRIPFESLSITYSDFASWQQKLLSGKRLAKLETYWKQALRGDHPQLKLPGQNSFHLSESDESTSLTVRIAGSKSLALEELSHRHHASLFMTMLAAVATVLGRIGGDDSVLIGTPSTNRDHIALQSLIGMFVNMLSLKVDLGDDPTFSELLERTRTVALDASAHQDLPFDQLVELLQPERKLGRHPLFDVVLNVREERPTLPDLPGVVAESFLTSHQPTDEGLTFYVDRAEGGEIEIRATYRIERHDSDTMEVLIEQLKDLLEQVAANPDKPISTYELGPRSLRDRLPDPARTLANESYPSVLREFLAQARQYPDRIALEIGPLAVSYGRLARAAAEVARELQAQGCRRGDVVAISGQRCFEVIASLPGILLAGGVMLPIDPDLPHSRQRLMLREVGARWFLRGDSVGLPVEGTELEEIRLGSEIGNIDSTSLFPAARSEEPAYVFFTSGSSGTPKAVLGSHAGLNQFIHWQARRFKLTSQDRCAQLTTLAFDALLRDVFLPLSTGSIVCLPEAAEPKLTWIERRRATYLHTVPSVLQAWSVEEKSTSRLDSLRWIFLSGEPLNDAFVRSWRKQFPVAGPFVNFYGPTETTMIKGYEVLDKPLRQGTQPIGEALPDTQILVLNRSGKLAGIGELGEIVIRTAFGTYGYPNSPADTAAAFVPDPFCGQASHRLYLTGDIGRFLLDGRIEILGRNDRQIKVRGVRIELDEVSNTLARHPRVESCAVAFREREDASRLTAWVVISNGASLHKTELRSWMLSRLPEAMVPSNFLPLDAIPKHINGKIDYSRLPDPSPSTPKSEDQPGNLSEELLAEIWRELLATARIGVHDDFFEAGGHSLLATQLVSRIALLTGIELKTQAIFEAPTIAKLATKIRAELRNGSAVALPKIESIEEGRPLLSFAQERLWFLHHWAPQAGAYNITLSMQLEGPLDSLALEAALDKIIARHDALRTRIVDDNGQPRAVCSDDKIKLSVVDLRELPKSVRPRVVKSVGARIAARPFDLTTAPLMRGVALQQSDCRHTALFVMHHIASDAWSVAIFLRELSELYSAFVAQRPAKLAALRLRYGDYATWQRNLEATPWFAEEVEYWKAQLAGTVAPLELSFDRPRRAMESYRGDFSIQILTRDLARDIRALSRETNTTPFMVVLAAFQTLLCRISGESRIRIGTPIANRTNPEVEGLIGFFVNTLVLQTQINEQESFEDLLKQVRQNSLRAYANQHLPFEKLVQVLNPERSSSHAPLFQVMFAWQNAPTATPELIGLQAQPGEIHREFAKFELFLSVEESKDGGFVAVWEYAADLFDRGTVQGMQRQFEALLKAILIAPDRPIFELSLLDATDRQCISEWNDTETSASQLSCLHEIFEEQARSVPDAVACIGSDTTLTFGELDRRANQLARALRSRGVRPGDIVGLCLERSPAAIVSILALWKAGATYLPLETSHPRKRLECLIGDAEPKILITDAESALKLAATGVDRIRLDRDRHIIDAFSSNNPGWANNADSAAYVFYTSGSTGQPKAAIGSHRSFVNRLAWGWERFPYEDLEVGCAKTPLGFLDSISEIFGPLLQGYPVVTVSDETLRSPRDFLAWLAQWNVSRLVVVPSLLGVLLNEGAEDLARYRLNDLKLCICSGEPLPSELARLFHERLPECALINLYGSSEVAADVTCHELDGRRAVGRVPVGRPIANARIYILDRHFRMLPTSVKGEVHVSGKVVGNGYLHRPAQTAECFLPDPFVQTPGARMYRTGDLGCWLATGELDLRGRQDFQVKIRGNRVELSEVEQALRLHPGIRDAIAGCRPESTGGQSLVVWYQAKVTITAAELREFLADRLPQWAVPSAFVELDELPLTPSGKIDRQSLPEPDQSRSFIDLIAPRDDREQYFADLWKQLLGLNQVGVHDDFFQLGGHSLLAMQALARIRTTLGCDLSIREFFEYPTVAQLALRSRTASSQRRPEFRLAPRDDSLPLSFAQERMVFIAELEPDSAAQCMVLSARLRGPLDVTALDQAMDALLDRHEALRTVFRKQAGELRQVILPPPKNVLRVVDLRSVTDSLESRLTAERERGFDLQRGPVFRASLYRLDTNEHALCLTLHHIAADGWSLRILLSELGRLYMGTPIDLPQVDCQYADYAFWQRQWLQGSVLEELVSPWREHLSDDMPHLALPVVSAGAVKTTNRGGEIAFSLPDDLMRDIDVLAHNENATAFMVFHTALAALLHHFSSQDDIRIGFPVAGRNHPATENTIGFFANTLVLRVDTSGSPTFKELLHRVRDTAIHAFANQELPFEKLVEALRPHRGSPESPLFQVFCAYQDSLPSRLKLRGLSIEPVAGIRRTTNFALSLILNRRENGASGIWEYASDLFDEETVSRLGNHFQSLLEQGVRSPDTQLFDRSILSSEKQGQPSIESARDAEQSSSSRGVEDFVALQTGSTPDKIAVVDDCAQLSYEALSSQSGHLCARLQSLNVGPESIVAVLLEQSLELVVASLAVQRSGAAQLSLDLTWPNERLMSVLADAAPTVLVTTSEIATRIPEYSGSQLHLGLPIQGATVKRSIPQVQRDHASYVIYTSGSTGHPKGVVVARRTLIDLVHWQLSHHYAGQGARSLLFNAPCFDVFFTDLFTTWAAGGTLVLVKDPVRLDPKSLACHLTRHAVETTYLPCSVLQLLAEYNDHIPTALREITTGGEQLHAAPALKKFFEANDCRLMNMYGPSESHVVTDYRLPSGSQDWAPLPAIGKPVSSAHLYVLDARLRPVPRGFPGDLYIGGRCLSRGYLNRPSLTAKSFLPDVRRDDRSGARMYFTGDRVRLQTDGSLEFLGRADFQVKVRGVRVELGEIEAVLSQHPEVSSSAVLAVPDSAGSLRLVAYISPVDASQLTECELNDWLDKRLPAQMIPAEYFLLDRLPLTATGKIDRLALSASEVSALASASEFTPPEGAIEELIAGSWTRLLGRERVGAHDDFFQLGGHSLLVSQMVSELEPLFETRVPMARAYQSSTVRGLGKLLAELLAGENAPQPAVESAPRERKLPLSFAQSRMWFLDRLNPGSAAYNLPATTWLTGPLDVSELETSIAHLVHRHEILRTTFPSEQGIAQQEIHSEAGPSFQFIDATRLTTEETLSLAAKTARRPFSLEQGPLFCGYLYRVAPQHHLLLISMHHIVADGASLKVLLEELASSYEAGIQDTPLEWKAAELQYVDYAVWSRTHFTRDTLQSRLEWWRSKLEGTVALDLPTDHPRPKHRAEHGATVRTELRSELTKRVLELGREEGATPFMTLLTAYQALLHRYSRQADIPVGTPVANRSRTEFERMIGLFVNTIVLRADFSDDPSFRVALRRVRQTTLQALANQDLPFEQLVDELSVERDLGRTPLFQAFFAFHQAPSAPWSLLGTSAASASLATNTAKFDLTAVAVLDSEKIRMSWEYDSALFEATTIQRMGNHFGVLLEEVVSEPDNAISKLCLSSDEERTQAIVGWNATDVPRPAEDRLHEMVEDHFRKHPDTIAAVDDRGSLSHAQLHQQAVSVAASLQRSGIKPQQVVGLYLDRGIDQLPAILGILRTGAICLPLDPEHPRERIRYMVEDSGAKITLTNRSLAAQLAPLGLPTLTLDQVEIVHSDRPSCPIPPHAAAYLIYTSGSTGSPKGTLNTHSGLCNTVRWSQECSPLKVGDRFLQKASIGFDVSIWEIFWPLTQGATLVMCAPGDQRDPIAITELLVRHNVTVVHFVPAMLQVFLKAAAIHQWNFPVIRLGFSGGEALPTALAARFASHFPIAELYNLYGPTEAAVQVSYLKFDSSISGDTVPIGRPIANTRIYLRDRHGQSIPPGIKGEICLGGANMALGYHQRSALTAECFVPDPYVSGQRLYQTGDLGRYDANGVIRYSGRVDHQIKIRGQRIEIQEVEAALTKLDDIDEAAATLRANEQSGGFELVAFVVSPNPVATLSVRRALRQHLPEALIPARIMTVESLPLNSSGKIDRNRLPALIASEWPAQNTRLPISTPTERTLSEIWEDALGSAPTSTTDNFFDLGGHSLLLFQIVHQIEQRLEIKLKPHAFFTQTLGQLAATCDLLKSEAHR